jgi:hypothetical protein
MNFQQSLKDALHQFTGDFSVRPAQSRWNPIQLFPVVTTDPAVGRRHSIVLVLGYA